MQKNEWLILIGTLLIIVLIAGVFMIGNRDRGATLSASVHASLPTVATSSITSTSSVASTSALQKSFGKAFSFVPAPIRQCFQGEVSFALKAIATCFVVFMIFFLILQRDS